MPLLLFLEKTMREGIRHSSIQLLLFLFKEALKERARTLISATAVVTFHKQFEEGSRAEHFAFASVKKRLEGGNQSNPECHSFCFL